MADEAAALNTPETAEAEAAEAAGTLLNGSEESTEAGAPAEGDAASADAGGENADGADAAGEAGESGDESAVPETYADFSLPEGVELDEATLEAATPIFKDLGLTQEQAQKLVDFQAEQVQAGQRKQADAFSQMMEDWQTQSRNDKEFGGDKFEENIAHARAAVSKFGTPELAKLLEDHGTGNHPEMIRFMVRVGKLTAEDRPGVSSGATAEKQDRVSVLYPNG